MKEFNFDFGSPVFCQDGQCGKLAKVVIDSDALQMVALIVEEGLLLKQARVFPISVVAETTPEAIQFSIESEETDNYPEYREIEFEEQEPSQAKGVEFQADGMLGNMAATDPNVSKIRRKIRQGISSDELRLLDSTTPVNNEEGAMGKLDRLVVDSQSHVITYLAIRQGLLSADRPLYAPVSAIESLSEDGIFINQTSEIVE